MLPLPDISYFKRQNFNNKENSVSNDLFCDRCRLIWLWKTMIISINQVFHKTFEKICRNTLTLWKNLFSKNFLRFFFSNRRVFIKIIIEVIVQTLFQQECIPVGCVPAERWPYSGVWPQGGCTGGGCIPKESRNKKNPPLTPSPLALPPLGAPPWKIGDHAPQKNWRQPPRKIGDTPQRNWIPLKNWRHPSQTRQTPPGPDTPLDQTPPRIRHPPDQTPPWGSDTPRDQTTPPRIRHPPGTRHTPRDQTPPLWTESHTPVKILPWPKLRFGR